MVKTAGVTGTVWIIANGKKIAELTETKTAYQNRSAETSFISETGKSITLEWHLRTSNSLVRSYMRRCYVSYDLLQEAPVIVEPEKPSSDKYLIVVPCESSDTVNSVLGKIKAAVAGKDVQIYNISLDFSGVRNV